MKSLPTIDPQSYDGQAVVNNEKIEALLAALFPTLRVPYDTVFQVLSFLQETNVNPQVLPKVIRGVHNIMIGTGKGQVIIHVQEGLSNVQIRENDEEIKTGI